MWDSVCSSLSLVEFAAFAHFVKDQFFFLREKKKEDSAVLWRECDGWREQLYRWDFNFSRKGAVTLCSGRLCQSSVVRGKKDIWQNEELSAVSMGMGSSGVPSGPVGCWRGIWYWYCGIRGGICRRLLVLLFFFLTGVWASSVFPAGCLALVIQGLSNTPTLDYRHFPFFSSLGFLSFFFFSFFLAVWVLEYFRTL